MARTRGASNLVHMDDGYIPEPIEAPPAPLPPAVVEKRYIFNKHTAERTMEAHDLVAILDLVLGGVALDLGNAEFQALSPNVKRHFRAVQV